MTIAITGATGHLGRLAIAALKARGATPIALARDPAKAADLGVETRAFDYTSADPAALKGVDTLVLISSNDFNDRAGQHRNVIAAASAMALRIGTPPRWVSATTPVFSHGGLAGIKPSASRHSSNPALSNPAIWPVKVSRATRAKPPQHSRTPTTPHRMHALQKLILWR